MSNFEKLIKIIDSLKKTYSYGGHMVVNFNPQTINYYTVSEELEDGYYEKDYVMKEKCITNGSIVDIIVYPVCQRSSISFFAENIDTASSGMIEALKSYSDEVRDIVLDVL